VTVTGGLVTTVKEVELKVISDHFFGTCSFIGWLYRGRRRMIRKKERKMVNSKSEENVQRGAWLEGEKTQHDTKRGIKLKLCLLAKASSCHNIGCASEKD